MKILIGIQARFDSKRLPGKVLAKIGEKTMLERVWDCSNVNMPSRLFSVRRSVLIPFGDERLKDFCENKGMEYYEGHETDLLTRYYYAAEKYDVEAVVRITADCPFHDTKVIEQAIFDIARHDYVSNSIVRSMREGLDVQAVSRRALQWFTINQMLDREHPFHEFDQNKIIRDEFEEEGYTYAMLVDDKNPIFRKTSIDTQEELESARKLFK